MKILNSNREGNVVHLEIERSPEAIEKNIQKAFRSLSKNVRIPGFRKGHITQSMFEKHFGRHSLIEEALNTLLNESYSEAVDLLDLRVVDRPKNIKVSDYKENEPVVFTCEVDVIPAVVLGAYDGLEIAVSEETVSDATVEAQIIQLLGNYATFETVARPVAVGDRVKLDVTATVDGEPVPEWTRVSFVTVGDAQFGEALDQSLIGASAGESVTSEDTFPETHAVAGVAGKTVSLEVQIQDVQVRQVPVLDDAFVQKISELQTVDAFRADLHQRMSKEVADKNTERRQEALIDALLAKTEIELQEVLIEREVDHMVSDFEDRLKRIRYSLDSYLASAGKTRDEIKAGYRESAIKRLKADLALESVAEAEKIVVTQEMMRGEILSWDAPEIKSDADVDAYLSKIDVRGFTELLKRRKALEALEAKANIQLELVEKGA
jgi:trigger factor